VITRTAKLSSYGNFERIGLTKEELNEVMDKLLEHNYRELQRIGSFLKSKGYDEKEEASAVTMQILAEKQLTSSFTVIANALDEKLYNMRSKARKPFTKEEQKDIKKKVEEGFKKKDTEEGKSIIEEAFEKTDEG